MIEIEVCQVMFSTINGKFSTINVQPLVNDIEICYGMRMNNCIAFEYGML